LITSFISETFRWHSTSKWGGLCPRMSLVVQQLSNMEEQKLSDHAQWLQRWVLNKYMYFE